MAIVDRKPARRVGVGNMYLCFHNRESDTISFEETVERLKTLTSITIDDAAEVENVFGSNEIYDADSSGAAPAITMSALALTPTQKARMKGNTVSNGYILSSTYDDGEYFAYGVVYPKRNGHFSYVWYPKCKAVSISDEAQTRDDDGINSQAPEVNIQTYPFDDTGKYKVEYDTELLETGATRVTEAAFFAAPLMAPING